MKHRVRDRDNESRARSMSFQMSSVWHTLIFMLPFNVEDRSRERGVTSLTSLFPPSFSIYSQRSRYHPVYKAARHTTLRSRREWPRSCRIGTINYRKRMLTARLGYLLTGWSRRPRAGSRARTLLVRRTLHTYTVYNAHKACEKSAAVFSWPPLPACSLSLPPSLSLSRVHANERVLFTRAIRDRVVALPPPSR